VLLNRHTREVDEAIAKVEDDPNIELAHKGEFLEQLRGYRADLKDSAAKLKVLIEMAAEVERG
jgi:predicted MPP superfamily phosphohydrolase